MPARDAITQPGYALQPIALPRVGETWASEPVCYEPAYGMKDETKVTISGDGLTLTLNRCSPARYRFFTFRGGVWQPGEYIIANPQR